MIVAITSINIRGGLMLRFNVNLLFVISGVILRVIFILDLGIKIKLIAVSQKAEVFKICRFCRTGL